MVMVNFMSVKGWVAQSHASRVPSTCAEGVGGADGSLIDASGSNHFDRPFQNDWMVFCQDCAFQKRRFI